MKTAANASEAKELADYWKAKPVTVESRIREACYAVKAMPEPWKFNPDDYVAKSSRTCCALGAVAVVCQNTYESSIRAFERVLGIGMAYDSKLSAGFRDVPHCRSDDPVYAFGSRLRAEFLGCAK